MCGCAYRCGVQQEKECISSGGGHPGILQSNTRGKEVSSGDKQKGTVCLVQWNGFQGQMLNKSLNL